MKNAPFHPPGTLAGKQPGSMAAGLGSAKSQLPSALLCSGGGGAWGQAGRCRGGPGSQEPALTVGRMRERAGGALGLPPPQPQPAQAPRVPRLRLQRPGGRVRERLQWQRCAVAGQPACPRPAAPRGAPWGRGVQMAVGTRVGPWLELLVGLGHLGRPVPAPSEAGHPGLC